MREKSIACDEAENLNKEKYECVDNHHNVTGTQMQIVRRSFEQQKNATCVRTKRLIYSSHSTIIALCCILLLSVRRLMQMWMEAHSFSREACLCYHALFLPSVVSSHCVPYQMQFILSPLQIPKTPQHNCVTNSTQRREIALVKRGKHLLYWISFDWITSYC